MRRFVVFTIMLMVALTASANYKGPDVRHMGTKKASLSGDAFFVCPERESNPHGIATTGF